MTDLLPQLEREGPEVPRFLVHLDPRQLPRVTTDVLVVGGGVAGLSAAIAAAEQGAEVLALLKGSRTETATNWAQGGMAASLHPDDSVDQHARDTMDVAAGLAHQDVVDTVVGDAAGLVDRWLRWGGQFDRDAEQNLALALEGGHGRPRILHAQGDQTGREIQRLLVSRAATLPALRVEESTFVLDLITDGGAVRGAVAWSHEQGYFAVWARATILCSGGVGKLYRETSNPPGSAGDGLGMAYRAGARLRGLEFVQFHPTVLYVAGAARILVSEVARGEGGRLLDRNGYRFMPDYHPDAELAPRDVVSRAIVRQLGKVRDSSVYLDMRHLSYEFLSTRFPVIYKACLEFEIDMAEDLIPVHPACHYMVGGVETDDWGRSTLAGLYACGEVASSGFHGANRMGSNSLLEGAVMGDRAGRHAAGLEASVPLSCDALEPPPGAHGGPLDLHDLDNALRALMWRLVGIERDGSGLEAAVQKLGHWQHLVGQRVLGDPFGWSLTNKTQVALLIALAASVREESRGTHFRRDFDSVDDAHWRRDVGWTRA